MAVTEGAGWSGLGWNAWTDLAAIRARLDAGADPNSVLDFRGRPLHHAAEEGSPEVVAELARRVDDVDAEHDDRTALWLAVFNNRPDNARTLVTAGADPWWPMMNGWSPGRLSLATPTPDLFPRPADEIGLSTTETAAVTEAERLITALGEFDSDGSSLACVAGVTAAEAVLRLGAVPADDDDVEEVLDDPFCDLDDSLTLIGVTDVPGGCVVGQTWGYAAYTSGVTKRLSAGTVCYAMYDNPGSGKQGSREASPATVASRGRTPIPAVAPWPATSQSRRSLPPTSTGPGPSPTASPARACARLTPGRSPAYLTCG